MDKFISQRKQVKIMGRVETVMRMVGKPLRRILMILLSFKKRNLTDHYKRNLFFGHLQL